MMIIEHPKMKEVIARCEEKLGVSLENETLIEVLHLLCDEIDYLHGIPIWERDKE